MLTRWDFIIPGCPVPHNRKWQDGVKRTLVFWRKEYWMITWTMRQGRWGQDFRVVSLAAVVCLTLLMSVSSLFAEKAVEVPLGADGVQRATVEVDSYSFSPSHLIVRAGKPVELTFKSLTTFVPHNIVIDNPRSGLSIREEVPAGERM